jgi:hypothetical protein
MLDEHSFQGLLSAAFTIQEHNDRRRREQAQVESELVPDLHADQADKIPSPVCPHCGVPKLGSESPCESCGQDELRPGERLQRNWASMWLMSQEQGLWPERSPEATERKANAAAPRSPDRKGQVPAQPDFTNIRLPEWPPARRVGSEIVPRERTSAIPDPIPDPRLENAAVDKPVRDNPVFSQPVFAEPSLDLPSLKGAALDNAPVKRKWPIQLAEDFTEHGFDHHDLTPDAPTQDTSTQEDLLPRHTSLALSTFPLSASYDATPIEAELDANTIADIGASVDPVPTSTLQRLRDLRVKLRFKRADVYLGTAIFVATLALLWPASGSLHPATPTLSSWDRVLIALGIAEAPAPVVHLEGDPAIQVWIDPHTALYYCPGEEQYGKAANGYYSTQREAQMDRFEPAARSACE